MPKYFLVARDGHEARSHKAYSAAELRAFRSAPACFTFINELTNSVKNVGACGRKRVLAGARMRSLRDGAPAPAAVSPAAPVATKTGTGRSRRRRR